MSFAVFLDNLVKKRGYSYRKLAQLSGVNHTYVSKICSGASKPPSPEVLKKLAPHLFIPYEELLRKAGYLLSEEGAEYIPNPDEEIMIRVSRLSPEGKVRLTDFLDYVEEWEKKQKK